VVLKAQEEKRRFSELTGVRFVTGSGRIPRSQRSRDCTARRREGLK
jgi:hypothetical protein